MEKVLTKLNIQSKTSASLFKTDFTSLFMCFFGLFIGRVSIFSFLNPLAIAYLSVFLLTNFKFYPIAVFVALGTITKFSGLYILKYILCIGFMSISNAIFTKFYNKKNTFVIACIGSISIFASGMIIILFNGITFYFVLIALLESVLVFSLTYILKIGVSIMTGSKTKKVLSSEQLISLAILFGGVISGASDIYIGDVSLRNFFCSLVILLVGYKGGSALASTTGVLLGLMLSVTGFCNYNFIIILAVTGMCSGFLHKKGKIFSVVFFLIGGFLITFYIDTVLIVSELFYSTAFAILVFMFLPEKFYFNISETLNPTLDNSEDYISRVKELTTYKLQGFSRAFLKLSITFSGLSEKKTSLDQKDISKLIDDIAAKVCTHCDINTICWQTNFYDTYQAVFSMLGACEKKGQIDLEDIPEEFSKTCIDLEKFKETANRIFELYRSNLIWNNKIIESRELVSQQLLGVSGIIEDLATELDIELKFREDIEQNLLNSLATNNIDVLSVIVLENKLDKYEVTFKHKECLYRKKCFKDILPVVNKVLGRRMKKEDVVCNIYKPLDKKNGICTLRLVEEQKFKISSAIARAVKDDSKESGDSYSFIELKSGQCLLALSDGMGSGKKARQESSATVELLEDFIDSGFQKELAIKIINSVLVLKSSEDSFSTLDICAFDTYTGIAEFIKIGAASTFIIRNKDVQVIKSSSLPMGILNDVDIEITTKKLKDNDVIVMVTDGIMEISETEAYKEQWIIDCLRTFKSSNPEDISEYLLLEAKKASNQIIKDDMTVLVARVWEKA